MDLLKLELIRTNALALRSTIHNEHMLSTIELCGMLSKKTNEIIDLINQLVDEVKDVTAPEVRITENYDSTNESLNLNTEVN